MKCQYPNCHQNAMWTPVVIVPTLRSAGLGQPMVETNKPTILLGKEVCQRHRDNYNLADWIPEGDWEAMEDVAHMNGYALKPMALVTINFRPLGWTPKREYLELQRD